MRYVLAFLVVLLGLEGIDRALLERSMAAKKPPREPAALRALTHGPLLQAPPPPPPPPKIPPGDWMFN